MIALARALLGVYYVLFFPVFAALSLAGLLRGLCPPETWANRSAIEWLLLAPPLYFAWLLLLLGLAALEPRLLGLVIAYKPRRATTADGWRAYLSLLLSLSCYVRAYLVWSLPLVRCLLLVPGIRYLVLWSYAPGARLGRDSLVLGYLYDPDLTEVGAGAIIGGASAISCHSVTTTTAERTFVYVCAPVVIGPRAVIGGEARLSLGVRVGADALVEPGSVVSPFTIIGPGEVWGGNPAVFLRKRAEPMPVSPVVEAAAADEPLRAAVAEALGLSLEEVHAGLSADDCSAWDSLGQLSLASVLSARFGVKLSAAEVFGLRSIAQVSRWLGERCSTNGTSHADELPADPELLPLEDHEKATRALLARPPRCAEGALELSVVVAATFTAELLAPVLKVWARAFGVAVRVQFTGIDQVRQALLAPEGPCRQNGAGLNVVLARPEDLLPAPGSADSLLSAIAAFARAQPGALVVGTLPPPVSPLWLIDRAQADALRIAWRERLVELGVELLDFSALVEEVGTVAASQADLEAVARAPYTQRVYQELGIALTRLVRRSRVAPAKVVALDADGVLWGGTVGEDGVNGIELGPDQPGRTFQLFQRRLLALRDRGALLVLVSRNEPGDVWEVFDRHPGMVLRRADVAAARIGWGPKSRALHEIAAELNLGIDSFVFLDDDPANRLEVAANAPGVTVVPLPAEPALYGATLARLWRFDAPHVTAEDQARALLLSQQRQRQRHHEEVSDLASYLRSLQLRARMRLAEDRDWPRIAQLTQKTNQFNLSLRRRTVAESRAVGRECATYVVEASDRFGDYGLIGVCVVEEGRDGAFALDTFLMSCRALGRGLEESVLSELLGLVADRGGHRLVAPYVAGPRNHVVKDFLLRSGFRLEDGQLVSDVTRRPIPEHIAWRGPETGAEPCRGTASPLV
jgi:FkbH-like protein